MSISTSKCHVCPVCLGFGCMGELPGLGGVRNSINFQLNCADWDIYPRGEYSKDAFAAVQLPPIRLAPITGAIENVGYPAEEPFYYDMIDACVASGIRLSIGDGCPDVKLQTGIKAVEKVHKATGKKAAVFIKPYENAKIFERIEWSEHIAEYIGLDIDAYNIVTMRNLVKLEKKTLAQITEIRKKTHIPFVLKGVFTQADLELVQQVHPDVVVVSNHGGRVENRTGSTIDFLAEHATLLKKSCGSIWIDGGIRKRRDLQVAAWFGASQVMVARPFITGLCNGGKEGVAKALEKILSKDIIS